MALKDLLYQPLEPTLKEAPAAIYSADLPVNFNTIMDEGASRKYKQGLAERQAQLVAEEERLQDAERIVAEQLTAMQERNMGVDPATAYATIGDALINAGHGAAGLLWYGKLASMQDAVRKKRDQDLKTVADLAKEGGPELAEFYWKQQGYTDALPSFPSPTDKLSAGQQLIRLDENGKPVVIYQAPFKPSTARPRQPSLMSAWDEAGNEQVIKKQEGPLPKGLSSIRPKQGSDILKLLGLSDMNAAATPTAQQGAPAPQGPAVMPSKFGGGRASAQPQQRSGFVSVINKKTGQAVEVPLGIFEHMQNKSRSSQR